MERPSENILLHAAEALTALEKNRCGLDDWLDAHATVTGERRSLSSLLFAFFRKKRFIDAKLAGCWRTPPAADLRNLLAAAFTLARFQRAVAAASAVNIAVDLAKRRFGLGGGRFANAVLRHALRESEADPVPAELLPAALEQRWRRNFGDAEVLRLAELFQAQAASTVRRRSGFETVEPPAGAQADKLRLPWGAEWDFFECGDLGAMLGSDAFARGAFYIQDPAPAAAVGLLKLTLADLPVNPRVVDLCAAPGGKLLMSAELLRRHGHDPAQLIALDRSERRQRLTAANAERCGVPLEIAVGDAAVWRPAAGRFDLVMVDVPCSNSGVFRRRPDALWRWNEEALREIMALQAAILDQAGTLTAPGGWLLYSTCSLESEENQQAAAGFLTRHPEFEQMAAHLWMPDAHYDGTFGALFRRIR